MLHLTDFVCYLSPHPPTRDHQQITFSVLNYLREFAAKEKGGGTGKFVDKKLTSDKNLFPAKYFYKMLYHQTTTNKQKKKKMN